MKEEELIEILKAARGIMPREEFRANLKAHIFNTPQKPPTLWNSLRHQLGENIKFGAALSLATLMLFVAFGSITHWSTIFQNKGPDFDNQELHAEASKLDFEIQLGEAQYFTESANEIAALLDEIDTASSAKNSSGEKNTLF